MKTGAVLFCWLALNLAVLSQGETPPRAPSSIRSRVVIVENRESISAFNPNPDILNQMIERGLTSLTGKSGAQESWRSLVSTQEIIGIKVVSAPGAMSGTRPTVVAALVQSLLSSGFPRANLIIWDRNVADLRLAGFADIAERFGVGIAGCLQEGYDPKTFYEAALLGKLVWGDLEFNRTSDGVGRKSHVSKLVTRKLTRVINVTPLLNHNLTGVSGNLYSLTFGSVDNTLRFESAPTFLATAVPEIYALPELGDRVVLNIVDALICQYQGEERTRLHYSTMLGQLRFSSDPVALDILSIEELNRQRQLAKIANPITTHFQIYTNASLLEIGVSNRGQIDAVVVR